MSSTATAFPRNSQNDLYKHLTIKFILRIPYIPGTSQVAVISLKTQNARHPKMFLGCPMVHGNGFPSMSLQVATSQNISSGCPLCPMWQWKP